MNRRRTAAAASRIVTLGREMRALGRQARLMLGRRSAAHPPADANRVVVFVHGLFASAAVFDPMRRGVERRLGVATDAFSYAPIGPFEKILEALDAHLARRLPADARVALVGHSLGGVLARALLLDAHWEHRVDRLITLATPHAGTRTARLLPSSLAAAVRPGSALLRALERRPPSIPRFALVAGRDVMCTPPSSAAALPGARVVWFDRLGHNELLFDPKVLDVVVRALATDGLEPAACAATASDPRTAPDASTSAHGRGADAVVASHHPSCVSATRAPHGPEAIKRSGKW
ncbi:MAG: alpha/beta fold hydrolase [Myxococcota bacterium]|nr:alpha/beta fold hydrolase [Myxococcota bacterium]